MLRKNIKSLLEQLQVCIFAEIVFGVRCTLSDQNNTSSLKCIHVNIGTNVMRRERLIQYCRQILLTWTLQFVGNNKENWSCLNQIYDPRSENIT